MEEANWSTKRSFVITGLLSWAERFWATYSHWNISSWPTGIKYDIIVSLILIRVWIIKRILLKSRRSGGCFLSSFKEPQLTSCYLGWPWLFNRWESERLEFNYNVSMGTRWKIIMKNCKSEAENYQKINQKFHLTSWYSRIDEEIYWTPFEKQPVVGETQRMMMIVEGSCALLVHVTPSPHIRW